jgi:sugar phosphate isomerase/epimerase
MQRLLWSSLLCLLALTAGAANSARHYNIGLQLSSISDDCSRDLAGTLKRVSEMGYTGVEFAGYYGRTAEQLRAILDADHLKCYGSHISLRDLLGDNFERTVAFSKTLGNEFLAIPGIPSGRRDTRAHIIETAHLFTDLATKLKARGITLAFHDEPDDFTPIEGDSFWNTFFANAGPIVKIQFDIGNALAGGEQAAPYLAKYPGRTVSVHVKDNSKTNPKAIVGEGDEDWAAVIPMLKARNGPRWFIVEQEVHALPPLESVQKCLENFRALLAKY